MISFFAAALLAGLPLTWGGTVPRQLYRLDALVLAAQPDAKKAVDADTPDEATRRAAFERAANRARAALVTRNLAAAARQLDAATDNVRLPAELQRVQSLRALSEQLELFFAAARTGLATLEPGDEIDLDGTKTKITAVRPDGVTWSIEGTKQDVALTAIPAPLLERLARAVADEKEPAAAAFLGAFQAADPRGDRQRARALWQQAAAGGVTVEDLLPLLEGPPLFARREPVPDAGLVAAAAVRVQGPLADLIIAAEGGPSRSLVARRLLDAARRVDNSPEQYAALAKSRDWAVSAGDPVAALAALDEMDRWFDVDTLELKSQALGAALAGSVTSDATMRAVGAALQLSAAAEAAERYELALTLADTAYNAARKVQEGDLIRRAYRQRSAMSDKVKAAGSKSPAPR